MAEPEDSPTARRSYDQHSSEDPSAESSRVPSRPSSPRTRRERGRVRFNSHSKISQTDEPILRFPQAVTPKPKLDSQPFPFESQQTRISPVLSRSNSISVLVKDVTEPKREDPFADPMTQSSQAQNMSNLKKPRPTVLRASSATSLNNELDMLEEAQTEKASSALAAHERARRVASSVVSHSAPASRRNSVEDDDDTVPFSRGSGGFPVRFDDIPLVEIGKHGYDDSASDVDESDLLAANDSKQDGSSEAHKLVRVHTRKAESGDRQFPAGLSSGLVSGQVTPTEDRHGDYVARPDKFRGGVLSSLLKLYNAPASTGHGRQNSSGGASTSPSLTPTPGTSGTTTPQRAKQAKWYNQKQHSKDTLANLIEASAMLGEPGRKQRNVRPGAGIRSHSSRLMDHAMGRSRPRLEDEIRITVHIAETLSRQKYLIRLCRALMTYGAPTHRLEEYMKMSARVLEIDGQFLYIPGCMLISFDDAATHTTEVKLVRSVQGVDLGKLKDVHEIYKEVVHDVIGVEEATQRLDAVIKQKQKHSKWIQVLMYGFASASVAPFAFQGRLIDLPIAFLLGSLLGFMQLILAPRSDLYSNVFEVSAAVLTSFLARAFGSIRWNDGRLFCFSALAQSSIALILPGYMVLCGALELQSRSMVAGSVRMVYAIIYSLFLGFGITIGTAMYGLMDSNATSATTCSNTLNPYWNFLFVPLFALCLCIINQAKWKQIPVQLFISVVGYTVNFFSAKRFPSNAQISNTLGALSVGAIGNLHSRLRHGVAAAAILPAIFVQVPSGLAASGSLLAGLSSADQITNSTAYVNGTTAVQINGTSSVTVTSSTDLNTIVFNVGYSMVQIAIGITVGLFLSALAIYPFGKRRSGLFSF